MDTRKDEILRLCDDPLDYSTLKLQLGCMLPVSWEERIGQWLGVIMWSALSNI
jgi:hypothetical protein